MVEEEGGLVKVERKLRGLSEFLLNFFFVEKFSSSRGFLQGIDPRVKLVSITFLIATSAFTRKMTVSLLIMAASTILAFLSGIPLKYYVARVWVFIPIFSGVISLPLLFTTPGSQIMSFRIYNFTVTATWEGLLTTTSFTLRVAACVSLFVLLILTTNFQTLAKAMEALKLPRVFIVAASITYRYTFLFLNEMNRLLLARESRRFKGMKLGDVRRDLASAVGVLFIRSYERAEKVYLSMISRGYMGSPKTMTEMKCEVKDYVFIAGSAAMLVVAIAVEFLGWCV